MAKVLVHWSIETRPGTVGKEQNRQKGTGYMRRTILGTLLLMLGIVVLAACGTPIAPGSGTDAAQSTPTAVQPVTEPDPEADPELEATEGTANLEGAELVVYSARKEDLMKPLVDAFEKETGIEVTLKSGKPAEIQLLIQQEKADPRADVYFTTDAGGAQSLGEQGLLEAYKSPNAAKVPAEFKAADGTWTGVIGRSRNIIINTERVKPANAPKSMFELTDPKYKDQVALASIEEGSVKLWLAWLLTTRGEDFTVKYIKDLKANGAKVLAGNSDVAQAVGRGEVPIGITNHYYYVFEKRDNNPVALIYPDQGENDPGTLVMPLTVSVVKGARHEDAAKKFVDFALSPAGQEPLTTQENEFPLVPGVALGSAKAEGVRTIDQIKRPKVDFKELAEAEKRVVELLGPELTAGE